MTLTKKKGGKEIISFHPEIGGGGPFPSVMGVLP